MPQSNAVSHEQVGRLIGRDLGIQSLRTEEALEVAAWAHELANESFRDILECDMLPDEDALNHVR